MSVSFPIAKPYSIPSDGQPYVIAIKETTLEAEYEYLAIPKVDLSAFLIAKVIGWERLNLIDGPANVYFGSSYIGMSKIDTRLMSDTLELSLGRDQQIVVSRQKLEDNSGKKLIGTKKTESFVYEILMKNNHQVPVQIKVKDQVPISQISEVTVEVEEISGALLEPINGTLTWQAAMAAGASYRAKVAFTVKYPRGMDITIRKNRIIRTPRFRH